jgi:hypothetical protein
MILSKFCEILSQTKFCEIREYRQIIHQFQEIYYIMIFTKFVKSRYTYTKEACIAFRRFTSQGPELHLDMSTPQGPELHLNLFEQHEPVLLLDVLYYRDLMLFPPSKVNSWI